MIAKTFLNFFRIQAEQINYYIMLITIAPVFFSFNLPEIYDHKQIIIILKIS